MVKLKGQQHKLDFNKNKKLAQLRKGKKNGTSKKSKIA